MAFTDNIKEITPATADIKNNTPVLIVDDKVLVGGIGGNFIPAGQGGGSASMDFYKCASVNTSDSTWSGYKAVLQSGVYSFQSDTTDMLSYTTRKPIVGSVYSTDALIKADLWRGVPTDDLVFYAPLDYSKNTAQTGQTFSGTSYISEYTTKLGIACAKFQTSNYLTAPATGLPTADSPSSLCVWLYFDSLPNNWSTCLGYANFSRVLGTTDTNVFKSGANGVDAIGTTAAQTGKWYFVVSTYAGGYGAIKTYVNGVLQGQTTASLNVQSSDIFIGNDRAIDIYLAGVRIYSRQLNIQDITALYNEFTPTSN